MRPIRENARNWMIKGGDGLFHTVPVERSTKTGKERNRRKPYERWKVCDTECCEHCPYPDCVMNCKTEPCLSLITYREYMIVRDMIQRRVASGENLCYILRDMDVSYSTLDRILRKNAYPSKKIQKKLKKYLEKEKEKET